MNVDPWHRPTLKRPELLRRRLGAAVVDNFFLQSARLTRMLPLSQPSLHGVRVEKDLPYLDGVTSPDHLLDVWRPVNGGGRLPIVLYIHGGGFRILSKDSHWLFGLMFARRGFLVFNVNYRLAPAHPFPCAVQDVCAAYEWVLRNAERYGGDTSRIVLAGESAGANLATSLTLSTVYRRPEPFAQRVFDTGLVPRAVIAACGIHQVSDPERFARRKRLPNVIQDRLTEIADAYFHRCELREASAFDLANPVCVLERGEPPLRSLPAFFAPCGTKDPLLDDTRRLQRAIERLGGRCDARYYPGEMHAFHAFLVRRHARQCWRDAFTFLEDQVRVDAPPQAHAAAS